MTFDECHQALLSIRRKQGTRCPILRVDCGGSIFQGRLRRADSDPEHRSQAKTPYGVLVLENPGLGRGPETVVQIANIDRQGIRDIQDN
jgi:hypothetical protein